MTMSHGVDDGTSSVVYRDRLSWSRLVTLDIQTESPSRVLGDNNGRERDRRATSAPSHGDMHCWRNIIDQLVQRKGGLTAHNSMWRPRAYREQIYMRRLGRIGTAVDTT
jgi:hypothetical protein